MQRLSASRPARTASTVAVLFALVLAQLLLLPGWAQAATTLTVSQTADVATNFGACGNTGITTPSPPLSLREAICAANNLGASAVTINVPAGTYHVANGELQIGKVSGSDISVSGAGRASTIIDAGGLSRVIDLDPSIVGGVASSISGVTISGGAVTTFGGAGIIGGSGHAATGDTLTLDSSTITDNHVNTTTTNKPGGGVQFQGGSLTITNSTISGNTSGSSTGSGVEYAAEGDAAGEQLTVSGTTFSANSVNASAAGIVTGGALSIGGPGTHTVSDSRFVNNTVVGSGTGIPRGAGVLSKSGALDLTGSTFTGNSVTGGSTPAGGAIAVLGGAAVAHYNRITGNIAATGAGVSLSGGTLDASTNWWGCNSGPGSAGCDTADGAATVAPRLVMTASASPSTAVGPNATSTITADLTHNSLGATVSGASLGAFSGLPVSFSDPPGDATVASATQPFASGQASTSYDSHTTFGLNQVNVSFDNATVSASVTANQAPTITSANTANFNIGAAGSFTVSTTGTPSPALSRTGTLPSGLSFTDNGDGTATLAGTPTGSGGSFPLSITANNGVSPNATQTLTVNVRQAPAFTSAGSATFTAGTPGSFTVTTSGIPTVSNISRTGTLPSGLTFTDNGNGTATVSGTPGVGTGGTYPIALTATNGVTPNATQTLSVQVNQPPAITSNPSNQTVNPGTSTSFSAAASGVPTPTVQWQRSTNGGASYSNVAGATSTTYTFTAAAGDNGNMYRAVFINAVSAATTTAATLTVGTAPAFTSSNQTTFAEGTAGSDAITTSGVPSATLSRTGAQFPAWLTLTDNGDGTGSLSGTPPAGSGGTYTFTLKAANGFSPVASQVFTLFVDASPVITSSNHATVTVGSAGSFTVTTTAGFPTTTTISRTGALPSGMSLVDNGDGTASLSGTPQAGSGGSYPITISAVASGGTTGPATQNFTLTVNEPPTITSANHATFQTGSAGSFTVSTAAGFPAATTLTRTGTLPSGLSFTDNGNGTATLSGTPAFGTGGTYTLTFTASNGVPPVATQAFTLTVHQPPTITSANHATFTVGAAAAFTVTTVAGDPTATTITKTGPLPEGLSFTDNGDGTATLGGTPTAGGAVSFTVKASNGVAPDATQTFTATVNQPPSITSVDTATFVVGSAGSFEVTTVGYPSARTLSATGALPGGVDFVDNGDGTGTISGTPDAGTGGLHPVSLDVTNSAGTSSQMFTLRINEAPSITSADHATFVIGTGGTFTVTTDGFARPTLTETGTLPDGVTFTDNADGTATLAGMPAAGSSGAYPLALEATNTVDHAPQTFTLTVGKIAQTINVTSTPPATATVGDSYEPVATSDSHLPVVYSIDVATTNSACSLDAGTVTFDHEGSCVLDVDQPGDTTYAAASTVQQVVGVDTVGTTLQLTSSVSPTVRGQAVELTADLSAAAGAPTGTVQFTIDGHDLGSPVPVSTTDPATSPLTDADGEPLAAGGHDVVASFVATDDARYAPSSDSLTQVVQQASTTAVLTVQPTSLTVSVTPDAPGAGTPTGLVTFAVAGNQVGSATLVDGTATISYTVPPGQTQQVSAAYAGDADFTATSTSTARRDPIITATVTSAQPRNPAGWYRSPVTVTFTCTPQGAPLVGACPSPVRFHDSGIVTGLNRTITATDGGTATVAVTGINLDTIAPSVRVGGVRSGGTYVGTAPKARCVARDTLSGVGSCTLRSSRRWGGHAWLITYVATATDVAGNVRTATVRYRMPRSGLIDATYVRGAYQVQPRHTYTLVVRSVARPVYRGATTASRAPLHRHRLMRADGNDRWVLRVRITHAMRHAAYWNLQVRVGSTMRGIRVHVR